MGHHPPVIDLVLLLSAMALTSSGVDETCQPASAQSSTEKRVRRTKDGSVYVYEPSTRAWRLEYSQPTALPDGPMPALPWAQFNVSFDGAFLVAGEPLLLAPGRGLRTQEEQQHGDTGRSIWDGSVALAKVLEHSRWLIDGRKVLELGSGRGVVALSAARLGASNVVATDLPYAIEELQEAALLDSNACTSGSCATSRTSVEVAVFDWTRPSEFFQERSSDDRFDVVLAADVIWLMELVDPLVQALVAICRRSPAAEVLIVHQVRAANVEAAFLTAMRAASFDKIWELPGISATAAADSVPKPAGGVVWHPDFTPDDRLRLWCFRLREVPGA